MFKSPNGLKLPALNTVTRSGFNSSSLEFSQNVKDSHMWNSSSLNYLMRSWTLVLSWERKEPQVCPVDRERVFCKATLNCFFGGLFCFLLLFYYYFLAIWINVPFIIGLYININSGDKSESISLLSKHESSHCSSSSRTKHTKKQAWLKAEVLSPSICAVPGFSIHLEKLLVI